MSSLRNNLSPAAIKVGSNDSYFNTFKISVQVDCERISSCEISFGMYAPEKCIIISILDRITVLTIFVVSEAECKIQILYSCKAQKEICNAYILA